MNIFPFALLWFCHWLQTTLLSNRPLTGLFYFIALPMYIFYLGLHKRSDKRSDSGSVLFPDVWWTERVFKGFLRRRDKCKRRFTDACQSAQRFRRRCEEDEEVRLTSIVGERAVWDELSWLQAVHQRAHPPWTPEKRVSPRAECAQLLHAPLLRAPVLKPHLT